MRVTRLTMVALTVVTAALGSAPLPAIVAAQTPDAAPASDPPGGAIVDTEASARREAAFRDTPSLPQVFVHQWVYEPPAVTPPPPPGAEPEPARLTVTQAVHEALTHNPGVAAQRLAPLRAREDVRRAEAIFDPVLTAAVNKDRRESPNASALAAVRTSVTQNFNANVGLRKTLRTGGDVAIDFTNNRFISNARFQGLVPQYRPELIFSLNQPLLRDFGLGFAYLLVDISRLTSESTQWTYRAQLANFVKQVIEAYWAVVFARQNLTVQRQSLELANATLRENQERVRVGVLAPVFVKEAESEAALREEQVIVAENTLDDAERTLRQIVYLRPEPGFAPRPIEPVEAPRVTAVAVDPQAAVARALEERPEVLAQRFDLESRQLTARVRENQLLPRLDFVGNVGLNGLSGDPVPTTTFEGETAFSPFGGDYGESLDRLTSRDFYSYQAGVEIEIPIGNAAAKSEYAQAKIDVAEAEHSRRQLLSDVTLEVHTAVNAVQANLKRIESARVARELAEENLRNQQKRLEVGMATTKDVLDFQDDLTQARATELQAAADYNVALAELARAQGTLLDEYAVVIEAPGERFVPWWARF